MFDSRLIDYFYGITVEWKEGRQAGGGIVDKSYIISYS